MGKQSRGDVGDTTTRKAENELDTVVTFDYATLDAETRIKIEQKTSELRKEDKYIVESIISMGAKFAEVRELLRHNKSGGFEGWYQFEGFKRSFVYGCMYAYERFGNLPDSGRLGLSISSVFALSAPSTPEQARGEVIERIKAGEKITGKGIEAIIAQYKPRTRTRAISYTPKEDDGYRDDVPAVKVGSMSDEPAITPTGRLPQPTPFKATHVITPQHNGDTPAVAPDGRKPDNVSTSGAIHRTNGEAPRSPSVWHTYARGEYWDVVDPNGRRVFAGQIIGAEGQLLANEFARLKNAHTTPVEAKHEETKSETLPFSQINELGIKPDDLNALINAHNKATKTNKGFDRVASILRYIREMEINPVDPLDYIRGELERASGKKEKKPKADKQPTEHQLLFGAICDQFAYDCDALTKAEKTRIGRVARELAAVGADVLDIKGLYAYCRSKDFKSFTENAFLSHWSAYKASDFPMKAHTKLVADTSHDPEITVISTPTDWTTDNIPETDEERAIAAEAAFQELLAFQRNGRRAVAH